MACADEKRERRGMTLRSFLYLAEGKKKRLPVDGLAVVRKGNAVLAGIFFALPERDDP